VQFNLASAFAGSANFTWNNTTQVLALSGTGANVATLAISVGGIQITGSSSSDFGLLVNSAKYNAVNIPNGGVSSVSSVVSSYAAFAKNVSAPGTALGSSQGGLSFQGGTSGAVYWYWNSVSGSWHTIDLSLAGGNAAGSTNQIQYNSGGAFAASSNLTWTPGTNQLTVNGAVVASTLQATSTAYNAISTGGGVSAATIQATAAASIYNAIAAVNGGISCGTGSAGGFYVGTTKVIDNAANLSVNGISAVSAVLSGGITAAGFNPTGHTGQTYTMVFAGGFTVGGTTFHNANYTGGVLTSVS
jgi:hypothetical protein